MENGLTIKQVICINDHQLINEVFNHIYEYRGYLIAHNSNGLYIISPQGDILVHEEGRTFQIYNYGECISIRTNHNDLMRAYRYDGTLLISDCYCIYIVNNKVLHVKKTYDDEYTVIITV